MFATAVPAAAHVVHTGYVGQWSGGNGDCVTVRAEVSHGSTTAGYFKTSVEYKKQYNTYLGSIKCYDTDVNMPAGWYMGKIMVYKWTGSAWALCDRPSTDEAWLTNNVQTDRMHWSVDANWTTNGPCGDGYYHTESGGYAWVNSAWRGGWINTTQVDGDKWHWLDA